MSARERNTRRPGGRPEWVAVQYLVLPGLGWDRIHPGGKLQDGGGCERTAQGDEDGPGRGTEERRRSSLVPPRAMEGAWRSVEEKARAPRKCEPGVWVIKSNTFQYTESNVVCGCLVEKSGFTIYSWSLGVNNITVTK